MNYSIIFTKISFSPETSNLSASVLIFMRLCDVFPNSAINRHLLLFGAAERVYLYASGLIFMRSCNVIRGQRYSNSTLLAVITVVPTATTSVCGPPSHHSVPSGPPVTTDTVSGGKSYLLHAWRLSCSTTSSRGL